jgi:hypothetical protein
MLCGKYMNGYHAGTPSKAASYVPPGWGDWYGFQTVDFFGTAVLENGVSKTYPKADYQTDIIANISLKWLKTRCVASLRSVMRVCGALSVWDGVRTQWC